MSEKDAQTHPANAKHDSAAVTSPPEGSQPLRISQRSWRRLRIACCDLSPSRKTFAPRSDGSGMKRSIRGGGFCRRPAVVDRQSGARDRQRAGGTAFGARGRRTPDRGRSDAARPSRRLRQAWSQALRADRRAIRPASPRSELRSSRCAISAGNRDERHSARLHVS